MKILILMGLPGAGKGTCANFIMKNYNYNLISLGDILRNETKKNSELGARIKSFISKGVLVSDDIIKDVMINEINKNIEGNIILDGFPRSMEQAHILDKIINNFQDKNIEISVLNIILPVEIARERLLSRIVCNFCGYVYNENLELPLVCVNCKNNNYFSRRKDDVNSEAVNNRINFSLKNNEELLLYYKQKGFVIFSIDSNQDLESVKKQIKKTII